jgi:hypothetical protein
VADTQTGVLRATLRQLVSLLVERLQQVRFRLLCSVYVAGLRRASWRTQCRCFQIVIRHAKSCHRHLASTACAIARCGSDCDRRSSQTLFCLPCKRCWFHPANSVLSPLQDFMDGAELCAVGGGALLGLSVAGTAALPFAPAAAVRAALLLLCTQPQLAAHSSSDVATQVRALCSVQCALRSAVETQPALSPAQRRRQCKPGAWSSA